MLSKTSPTG